MAEYLAPRITKTLKIKKVVDMGCATGHWVSAFLHCGAEVIGIEGSVNARPYLLCPEDRVIFTDLRKPLKLHFENVDLVLSIEVAEHIETRYAEIYVRNIVNLGSRWVMLTAAPPGQGGLYHVNEQHPEYWISLFARYGYSQDHKVKDMISQYVDEGRNLLDPPPIMRRFGIPHHGVWIPNWMPKNLLIFTRISGAKRVSTACCLLAQYDKY